MTARRNAVRVSKVMRRVFGLAELGPGQHAVIEAVLAKRHTLAIMPTGEARPQLLTASIEPLVAAYEQRRQRDQTKLEQIVIDAQTARCRTHVLPEALAETVEWSPCGTCDNCRGLAIRSEAVAAGAA